MLIWNNFKLGIEIIKHRWPRQNTSIYKKYDHKRSNFIDNIDFIDTDPANDLYEYTNNISDLSPDNEIKIVL
jgi:hypothetical protein